MPSSTSGPSDRSLSTETISTLLAHERRHAVLDVLRTHDEPLPLADLADEVAVRERERRIDSIPAEEVKRIYMSLYHRHVAKLANHGVVEYDQDRDIVALTERAGCLMPFLELATEDR